MSETTKLRSPNSGAQVPDKASTTAGVVFFAMIWIAVFAYGVYIKTI